MVKIQKQKTGRNDPCPCGSGKKFKKCCHDYWYNLPRMHAQANLEFEQRHLRRLQKYGDVRPVVHSEYKGKKVIAEGSRLYFLDKCKTFHDFLSQYVKMQFGKEWWMDEVKKSLPDRHPIIQLAYDVYELQKKCQVTEGEIFATEPTGPNIAFLTFAYDYFVLRDNGAFQNKMLKRLRFRDQFYGARYEMHIAAAFVKGGFEITYEDESDSSKKHPEFLAKHKKTGQVIAVECKKRHRKKVTDCSSVRLEIDHLFKKALEKEHSRPLAIFIDIDVPPISGNPFNEPWAEDIKKLFHEDIIKEDSKDRFNLLVLTNHPTEYHRATVPHFNYIYIVAPNPKNVMQYPNAIDDIIFGVSIFDKIPTSFDD